MDQTAAFEREHALPGVPESVGRARRLVRDAIRHLEPAIDPEAVALAVSEVVTNAVVHAGTAIGLAIHVGGGRLRIEVSDGSRHLPARRDQVPLTGFGRGLVLLEDAVDAGGVSRGPHGKTVWFEFGTGSPGRPAYSGDPGAVRPDSPAATGPAARLVVLRRLPLLLYAVWRVHAETVLREYLLLRAADEPERAVAEHAGAHDAMALLEAAMPTGTGGIEDLLRAQSLAPADRAPGTAAPARHVDVALLVTAESAASFVALERLLGHVARPLPLPRDLLTATVPAELRELRSWLCREVLGQLEGAAPIPWALSEPAQVALGPASPESTSVAGSGSSQILVDDAAMIIAVSGSLAGSLGYLPVELTGRPVRAVVPRRLWEVQAAGFALHLLDGRDVLLHGEVSLPVLRADGSETVLHGRLRRRLAADGRPVFLGELG
jgi:PAS domain S-box-containing protein